MTTIRQKAAITALLLWVLSLYARSDATTIRIDSILSSESGRLLGVSVLDDKLWSLWTFDLTTFECGLLVPPVTADGLRVLPGSTVESLFWETSHLEAGRRASWQVNARLSDFEQSGLLDRFLLTAAGKEWGHLIRRGILTEPLRVFGQDGLLFGTQSRAWGVGIGSWRPVSRYRREYFIWDVRLAGEPERLERSEFFYSTRLESAQVSERFGSNRNFFVFFERGMPPNSGGDASSQAFLSLFSVSPFRQLDRIKSPGRFRGFFPGDAHDELVVVHTLGTKHVFAKIKLDTLGLDARLRIEPFDQLSIGADRGDMAQIAWSGGAKWWSVSDPTSATVESSSAHVGEEAVMVPGHDQFSVTSDGSTLVTWRDGPVFRIWRVERPKAELVSECQVFQAGDGSKLRIVVTRGQGK